ncbi:acetyl-CoA carboxylase biotin carboxyl carrier protein [Clostridium sp. MT-14]|jgi:acetyl-CoA carboxylase biotin carboxyl carrier protein|uniref:Biotin carboxyl carrier protein of acetyl-CoA carboxylase n=1 Tax=Clostridium aromativorans TaxID=2836848 RepID=A0ABS8N3V8_9CLOT|nr:MULTISPECIES: acetyl-CoA carboxylase biotin carboxyl carrier protein [Clostridium]KAA8668491.1 acetyl-CoA carboxylase biotin carboxyl carrier protein [Clostridium sp. HV4-5-A1G]MCC9294487.1 acetyl-CoA carboxylase biotin carboxyl carrier protein [Clostridium aromativorans]CAB1255001.1 Biotin carboxyl carrier protein of acetyl-CoA carboxylase [Clostridiaceae bacterium BL-3]
MDFEAIENMIKVMDNSKLGYLEINWQDISIIMKKKGEKGNIKQINIVKENEREDSIAAGKCENKCEEEEGDTVNKLESDKKEKNNNEEEDNIKEVTSPIVGTFYSSPDPEKPAFVNVGSKVKKGDTLCVIEAMKLMNDIQSEIDGEVVEILAKNEQMVEYGQPLFKIKTDN